MHILRAAWAGWKCIVRVLGDIVARVVLTAIYFTVLAPFGLILKATSDPLEIRAPRQSTFWKTRESTIPLLKDAQKGF